VPGTAVAALVGAAVAILAAACQGGKPRSTGVAAELQRSLVARELSVRWVACVRRPERARGAPVYRCNVEFGDPHVEIYCAAVVDGRLRALPWRRAVRGAQDRAASAHECAARLRAAR
jgi:hypothetical protein